MTSVCIIGLGYVGTTVAGCLASRGHHVIGVEKNSKRLHDLQCGKVAMPEPELADLLATAIRQGSLTLEASCERAVAQSELTMLCVGTPAVGSGYDYTDLRAASEEVGRALAASAARRLVVVRSTVTPGTTRGVVIPAIERAAGKRAGAGFGVVYNPEFLREGQAVHDFHEPALVVIGGDEAQDRAALKALYDGIAAPVIETGIETSEMVKLVSNTWHALKVCFANEVGRLSRTLGIDSHELMAIFCRDTRLNISPAYLSPGFAFGGPCLPKDVGALAMLGAQRGTLMPLIEAVLPSNEQHLARAAEIIKQTRAERIGVIGLAHNHKTGDLRDSQAMKLISLLTNGDDRRRVRAFDESVPAATRLNGDDGARVEVVGSIAEVVCWCEVLVIAGRVSQSEIVPRAGQVLIDLVRQHDWHEIAGERLLFV